MQLKQFYDIATKASSRKNATTFGDLPDWSETIPTRFWNIVPYFDALVKERRNSIANALELRLSCTNPSICSDGSVSHSMTDHICAIMVLKNV